MPDSTEKKIISAKATCEKSGLSKTTIWREVKLGRFPKPITLSKGRKEWLLNEINEWIDEKAAARGSAE